eukprot:5241941-Karenia_brevis.AAC.1
MEVKRAKIGQHRPNMEPRCPKPTEDTGALRRTYEDLSARWRKGRAPRGFKNEHWRIRIWKGLAP